ncbi:magnesium transporter [Leptospira sp. 2 VSF19]|uniref:Magnesium transporter MgtE n=1 Tax=Leptospira soteropolitanensis TaxID=2950025 RepID=A0AAW5VEB8_9LEPT|nr:magnesium transporter [Leptospira soteropolitanensis]MCW7492056.1 magnesium transporter [Leptospira soteropolitanensis]MCW7499638.1 magnesium transporter [Leptospira soteropolitanensis]MCW7521889.1 magnesium transporter [Leptospira soteropolitanensis]MCW7525743.1 magnesium transporter [Leptospira soteropolitanensis]MCW7530143.1 magnesium transporter [Leptospira soteropolitanensis]
MEEERKKESEFRIKIDKDSDSYDEFVGQIKDLISNEDSKKLKEMFDGAHPADIVTVFRDLERDEELYLFRLLSKEDQAYALIKMEEETLESFLEDLSVDEISHTLNHIETDETTYLLSYLPSAKRELVLANLSKADSFEIRSQLGFRESSAGRLMSKDFATVSITDNVRKGIINVRKKAKEIEDIYQIYVTNEDGVLEGFIPLKDLFLTPINTKVAKITNFSVFAFHYDVDQEEVANTFKKYDLVSAAVTDDLGRIIGRITVDDVLEIVEEEASEDILLMAGVSEDERLSTPILQSVKRRIVWLNVNLLTAFVSSTVVAFFEDTISQIVVLATLMPIVAGLGGNAGTQSVTVVIRNIATGDLSISNWWEAVRKEFTIGILNGLVLGFVTGCMIFLVKGNLVLGFVVGTAMFVNMIVASLTGSLVPIVLKGMRIDPAIASSIFVTATTDVCGFFFFLGLATVLAKYLL